MNTDLMLNCPACGLDALADDEFCESCGEAIGLMRDARRNHLEIEAGPAAGVSDRGLVHARNEDAMFLATVGPATVVVVCDGVSSSAAPQVAAEVAARAAGSALLAALDSGAGAPVGAALQAAATAVDEVPWMAGNGEDPPSCTIVVAVWDGESITVGWSGDSRAYWVGDGGPCQLTSDHTLVQADVDAGLVTVDQVMADPRAHVITRWLGADAPDEPLPISQFHPPGRGTLVVCSDGFWNHLESASELAVLVERAAGTPVIDVARTLTRCALERGGHDNITVVVIPIAPTAGGEDEEERP